jgi:glyoxylase-like metal-dependent hydrolase (beta-lactamase superfamily II)
MSETIANFISARTVEDAEVAIIFDSTGVAPIHLNVPEEVWRSAAPEFAGVAEVPSAITTTIVRRGKAIVVIDPGLDDPDSRLGARMSARSIGWTRSPGLQAGLVELGIDNDEVTHVVITHAHFDHCLGVTVEQVGVYRARFPNARHFIGQAEWRQQPEPAGPHPTPRENPFAYLNQVEMWPRIRAIHEAGLLELVEGRHAVAAGVEMLPAPGETPGHCVVRIGSGAQACYHLADLVHYWFEFEQLDWIVVDGLERDAGLMETTRRWLLSRIAAEHALVTYSHAPFPGWGRIVERESGFRWEPA